MARPRKMWLSSHIYYITSQWRKILMMKFTTTSMCQHNLWLIEVKGIWRSSLHGLLSSSDPYPPKCLKTLDYLDQASHCTGKYTADIHKTQNPPNLLNDKATNIPQHWAWLTLYQLHSTGHLVTWSTLDSQRKNFKTVLKPSVKKSNTFHECLPHDHSMDK